MVTHLEYIDCLNFKSCKGILKKKNMHIIQNCGIIFQASSFEILLVIIMEKEN